MDHVAAPPFDYRTQGVHLIRMNFTDTRLPRKADATLLMWVESVPKNAAGIFHENLWQAQWLRVWSSNRLYHSTNTPSNPFANKILAVYPRICCWLPPDTDNYISICLAQSRTSQRPNSPRILIRRMEGRSHGRRLVVWIAHLKIIRTKWQNVARFDWIPEQAVELSLVVRFLALIYFFGISIADSVSMQSHC